MKGFIVFDYAKKYPTALQELASWLSQGKLKRKEHIVPGGIEGAPRLWWTCTRVPTRVR